MLHCALCNSIQGTNGHGLEEQQVGQQYVGVEDSPFLQVEKDSRLTRVL